MRIAVTGFVEEGAGSIASAGALFLNGLLERGHTVRFFSKGSFVDPRPVAGRFPNFEWTDVDNVLADRCRRWGERVPVLGRVLSLWDSAAYNRLLVARMAAAHRQRAFDVALWLGDAARGRVDGLPTVSFVQGAPGTDARSIQSRAQEIIRLAGRSRWLLLSGLSVLRQSKLGLPDFSFSDRIVVGSRQSANTLSALYGVPAARVVSMPYPMDLGTFRPGPREVGPGPLRCLWLGRIVPRKRLDLFLNGAAEAVRRGTDVRLTVVGSVGFVPGYEKLIEGFPYRERLEWIRSVPRSEVAGLMSRNDVLIQPSEEEDFGSSVAEAQACGLRVVVGRTNGNADYLMPRDVQLTNDDPLALAYVLGHFAEMKRAGTLFDVAESERNAREWFSPERAVGRLVAVLREVAASDAAESGEQKFGV